MIEVKLKKLHSMSTVGTFKRIIPKRCQNGISPLSEAAEESPFLHGNSPMKPFILFTMAGIKPTIPDYFELFGLQPGDTLVLMADKEKGIALQTVDKLNPLLKTVFNSLPSEAKEANDK